MKQLVLPPGCRVDQRVLLTGDEHHYLSRVRRLLKGDHLTALEAESRLELEVISIGAQQMELRVLSEQPLATNSTAISLFPFLLKARKLDDVIRQAGEVGIHSVIPVLGDHCVSRFELDNEKEEGKKLTRWNLIAKEAAQQSGNSQVCQVLAPQDLKSALEWWNQRGPLVFFHQEPLAKASLHRYLSSQPSQVGLIVGPEGGLSTAEVDRLLQNQALPVWLGPNILRAETASLYAAAAVKTILQEHSEWIIPS